MIKQGESAPPGPGIAGPGAPMQISTNLQFSPPVADCAARPAESNLSPKHFRPSTKKAGELQSVQLSSVHILNQS